MKTLKNICWLFVQWIKHAFQGRNGTASSRRITAFWFVVLSSLNAWTIQIIISLHVLKHSLVTKPSDIEMIDRLLMLEYCLCVMILLLFSVVTFQQVVDFKNGNKVANNTDV